jgi:hypothetical protein
MTETISARQPTRFITDLALAAAPEPDNQQLEAIHNRLAGRRVLPPSTMLTRVT